MNERGVSFHLFDLPGYPASHACVRLLLRDAQWLYGWGEQWKLDETKRKVTTPGTPVVVLGTYPSSARLPRGCPWSHSRRRSRFPTLPLRPATETAPRAQRTSSGLLSSTPTGTE